MDETGIKIRRGPAVAPERPPDPCVLVLFGATGDLTHRKLVPALYNLAREGDLPERFAVIATSTSVPESGAYRSALREGTAKFTRSKPLDEGVWESFAARVETVAGNFHEAAAFRALQARVLEAERRHGTGGNRLFYLAVPPSGYPAILGHLRGAGLLQPARGGGPWSRVVIEKPFGRDLASARELNRLLGEALDESQVFRIDHYLGKETVQNILVFRFGNSIFEPLWNRNHIDHVQITMAEDLRVERRGKFYDATGVLRDVVQSHLLQVLALSAMEAPGSFRADDIRDEKLKLFRALRPVDPARHAVAGQYRGYREEEGVARDSRTPTYAAMRVFIDNWRWQGVPFYLRAGKALRRRLTEVSIAFRTIPFCLFGREEVCSLIEPNVLALRIQPDEGISLRFACKVPGDDLSVGSVTMDFSYARSFGRAPAEAYERLLLDAMRGDATLFARRDGDEQAWAFVTPVLEGVGALGSGTDGLRARERRAARGGRPPPPRRPPVEAARMSEIIVAPEFAPRAAEWIVQKVMSAVRLRDRCSVALAGGSTPRPVYEELGRSDRLPWEQVEFYFSDERGVPLDHPESNYQMARETLFRSRPDALARTYRMLADAERREDAADRYARKLPDPLDLLILGMGADGHTASLFPGSPALDEKSRRVVAVEVPVPPRERLTITPPVIERARAVVMLVAGAAKAEMVARALGGPWNPKEVPAQFARPATWILDPPAARQLSDKSVTE